MSTLYFPSKYMYLLPLPFFFFSSFFFKPAELNEHFGYSPGNIPLEKKKIETESLATYKRKLSLIPLYGGG